MARVPAEERRLQFVEAAARVIAQDGLASATTRRIASEAEAPLAALHYCFRSKDELLEEVYNFLSRDYAKALEPVADPGMGLRHMVGVHARRIWSRMLENPHEQVTTFELLLRRFRVEAEDQPQALLMNRSMYDGWVNSTLELFRAAAEAAGEPVPANLEDITRMFISGIDGISMQHLADPDDERSLRLVELMASSLAGALHYD
ncbi:MULTISPECIES: TetR family transcriptional regulator [Micrococcaceae]|jgi:AcrR family transcriptional regulator|uniref:Transcriptional regulator, TetR family n=1 Tax=Paenarthrobacter aurescens (strain TC1) TaxID=290340 RepID=A1R7R4_PAEAT|nr:MULTISPECIES: TetR family transcriptional regulator [Micrococcaceae]ABM06309.1 putative transcriptional regulator, TetR family [Paenarthrobacter aurescens TC1]AFR29599.1 putative transcriptional regulator, TetR family [Arthrobacter sp. Rue61a]MBP2265339.1 AcrR family transcriptional regulator [Pseudarthrobacter sp. PvP004]